MLGGVAAGGGAALAVCGESLFTSMVTLQADKSAVRDRRMARFWTCMVSFEALVSIGDVPNGPVAL